MGVIVIIVMGILIVIDCINSVSAVYRLNLRLKEISEISQKMYDYSQKLGRSFADKALEAADAGAETAADIYMAREKAAERADIIKEEVSEKKDELIDRLRARYDALTAFTDVKDKRVVRLIKAFPSLKSVDYGDTLEKLRTELKERIRRKGA